MVDISVELPYSEKAQTVGLIVPENGGFPCVIDGLRVFATDAGLSSLILRVLETVLVVSKQPAFLEIKKHRENHDISCHTRRKVEILATVFSCTKIRQCRLSPLVRKPLQRLT